MTNSELWDVIMEIYKSKHSKDTPLVISSIDDHFNCYFDHNNGQLHFRITVQNSFFSERIYILNNIYHIKDRAFSNLDVSNVTESKLKELLVPIIREAKLNLIGM